MKVKAKCPASCGELMQGLIGDGEKLISLPIDIYSEVTLWETKNKQIKNINNKATIALKKTFEYFNVPKEYLRNIMIEINSDIPMAKGMASSTADIAATIVASAMLLGKRLTCKELGELCCRIEPTDSTIFEKLTLFDHINGKIIEEYNWNPSMKVLVLESDSVINTEDFRREDYSNLRKENQKELEKAYEIFSLACKSKDKKLLGKAATISSIANEKILIKPMLNEIIEIAYILNAYGVNVAHSGTVVGILYDENMTDIDELKYTLNKINITKQYTKVYSANMIKGGVKIVG